MDEQRIYRPNMEQLRTIILDHILATDDHSNTKSKPNLKNLLLNIQY